jgi:hypothetical protein
VKKVHGFKVIEVESSLAVLRHRGNTDSDIGESRWVRIFGNDNSGVII